MAKAAELYAEDVGGDDGSSDADALDGTHRGVEAWLWHHADQATRNSKDEAAKSEGG